MRFERGIAYVPEDRRRHGVVGELPVRANITLAILNRDRAGHAAAIQRANAILRRRGWSGSA